MSLKIGQKIKHPQHGVGIVKSIDGDDAVVDFETGMEKEEKGVHLEDTPSGKGVSAAGYQVRSMNEMKNKGHAGSVQGITAKKAHYQKLNELKNMPKPNLPKSEEMSKDDMPHEPNSPEDKAHDIVEEGDSIQQALAILDTPEKQKQMFEHLRTLVEQSEHRSDENQEAGQAPAQTQEEPAVEEVEKKEESCIQKSEYSAREVAIAVLKKAESMAREWQNSKPEKVMQDSVLSEKRDVVNENDIIDAASQAMTDKSPLRLKAWIEARKAKK